MSEANGEHIILYAPIGRTASIACELFQSVGLSCRVCNSIAELQKALASGVGVLLLIEEAVDAALNVVLRKTLSSQAPWSDMPIVIAVDSRQSRRNPVVSALAEMADVTLLERPLRPASLITVMRSALRARRRQYEVRDLLQALNEQIRERERAEDELKHLNESLEERVAARTKELEQSETRFRTAFHSSPTPTLIVRLSDGCCVDVNGSLLKLTQYQRGTLLEKPLHDLHLFSETDLQRLMTSEPGDARLEVTLTDASKLDHLTLVGTESIVVDDEACLLATFVDISDRRRNEEQLMQAIEVVMQDASWFSRSVVEKLAQIRSGRTDTVAPAELTGRERDVLEQLVKGYKNKQIARELGIAENTVRNTLQRLYAKLDVHSRAEAIIWARGRGLSGE